jgi:hypothetical protein
MNDYPESEYRHYVLSPLGRPVYETLEEDEAVLAAALFQNNDRPGFPFTVILRFPALRECDWSEIRIRASRD